MSARRKWTALAAGMVGATVCIGCASQPYLTTERMDRGLAVVLPGIEGRSPINESICRGLDQGGVDWAIELYDWTRPMGGLVNLWDEPGNRRRASLLAQRIRGYQEAFPGRPVVLVGQSAGCGMAVWAMESLPQAQPVEGAVLLAAALSPAYNLQPALARSRRGIVNFYSPYDWMMLGLGSTVAGTMDGRHTEAAGRVGFELPEPGGAAAYQRLFQVCWNMQLGQHTGYLGGHFDSGSKQFVARIVAPILLDSQWDSAGVGTIHLTQTAKAKPRTPARRTALGSPLPKPRPIVAATRQAS